MIITSLFQDTQSLTQWNRGNSIMRRTELLKI